MNKVFKIFIAIVLYIIAIATYYADINLDDWAIYLKKSYVDAIESYESNVNRVNSVDLKETKITATLDEKIIKGKNIIFCATFQMSWNELCKKLELPAIKLFNGPEYINKLNSLTNEIFISSNDSYFTMSGYGYENIIQKINLELNKFSYPPLKNNDLKPDELISFSYLSKKLYFKDEYEKIDNFKFISSNDLTTEVYAFGIKKYNERDPHLTVLANQVEILVQLKDFYILELKTLSSNESLILSSFPVKDTLLSTFYEIDSFIEHKTYCYNDERLYFDGRMLNSSEVRIPKIIFKINHEYDEIAGKPIINQANSYIKKALQVIDFKLNEKGALLDSYSAVDRLKAIGYTNFHFNKPFILFLKEKSSKLPYFMIYIDNAELLQKK